MNNFNASYLLYGIIGIVIDYIVITFGIPYVFPNVYRMNSIKNRLDVTNVRVPLILGACTFDNSRVINTSNPYKNNFIFMPHSNNIKGGSQFTYTFWLDIKSNFNTYVDDTVIFMRGVKDRKKGLIDTTKSQNELPLVACPLVKFAKSTPSRNSPTDKGPLLEVIFNTVNNPHNKVTLNEDVYKLITSTNTNRKWFLISIVFQDYMDFTNNEKGIQIQNYVNDNLVSTKVIKNDSLKLNNCDVHLAPYTESLENNNSFYADLTYYNYAMDILDIEKVYNFGVTNNNLGCLTAENTSATQDDYYNKLSMNNYL
jgi:hypothetical protein